jgi:transposase
LLLNRKEKEKLVIQLAHEGKTTREIAKQVHISLRDIGTIIRKETGDDKEDLIAKEKQKHDDEQQKEKEKQERLKFLSPYARSFQMFKDRLPLEDVAIELDLDTDTVLFYYEDYLRLLKRGWLVKIYKDLKNDFPLFIYLYKRIKKEGLKKHDIKSLVKNQQDLKFMEHRVDLYSDFIRGQQLQKQQLEQEINRLQSRIDNFDKIPTNKIYKTHLN